MRRPADAHLARATVGQSLARLLVLASPLLGGCDGPHVAIVCHNANCAGPVDPARDDTLAALSDSLALAHDGKPVIDGIELDLLWSSDGEVCLFAHDHGQTDAEPAQRAAELVATHLASAGGSVARPYYLKLDLKGSVDGAGSAHSEEQSMAHAACAIEVLLTVHSAALRSGTPLGAYLDSESPRLLRALSDHPEWSLLPLSGVDAKLSAGFTVPGVTSAELRDFEVPLGAVSVHPDWLSSAVLSTLDARGIELTLWTRSLGARQLRAIADLEPRFVSTSDALRLRRWLAE